jgi:replicative DNA helicase
MFAYRPAYYGITDVQGNKLEGLGYILIAKGRNIGTGEVMFGHDTSMTRIWDMKPDQVQSVKDPF